VVSARRPRRRRRSRPGCAPAGQPSRAAGQKTPEQPFCRYGRCLRRRSERRQRAAGHAWVFAPPFRIVDVTLRQQPYRGHERDYLPPSVFSENAMPDDVEVDDLISPPVRAMLRARGVSGRAQLAAVYGDLPRILQCFDTCSVVWNGTRLKYAPAAFGVSEAGLEQITNITFLGRSPLELYTTAVGPHLSCRHLRVRCAESSSRSRDPRV
jgi:hypothetical protein